MVFFKLVFVIDLKGEDEVKVVDVGFCKYVFVFFGVVFVM